MTSTTSATGRIAALVAAAATALFVSACSETPTSDDHDDPGLYFGARNGSVWGTFDDGATWTELVRDLPDVMVVRAARV